MTECPCCGSLLVQPLRWQASDDGAVLVDLRCPECQHFERRECSKAEMQALDLAQAGARQALVDSYERVVAESMEALAFCLGMALDLDLLGADDFAPRRHLPAV